MLAEPALRIIESEDRVLLLAPMRRPCCLELLCYQETSFSRAAPAGTQRFCATTAPAHTLGSGNEQTF
jgi:hypothetical protein